MTIPEAISIGLFRAFVILIGLIFAVWFIANLIMIVAYRKGEVRFMDLSPIAQWFVLTFFNDGDGDGFA